MLANYNEANKYLDQTKLRFENDDDAQDEIEAADAVIRAGLFDVYGDAVYTWEFVEPPNATSPPAIVTEYAAMWMAALRYSTRYSEETLTENSWSMKLFEMVKGWFSDLRTGSATITGLTSGIAFSEDDFWPNSTTVDETTLQPDRKFTMGMTL